jgi:flagellin-specific chaperone FliS
MPAFNALTNPYPYRPIDANKTLKASCKSLRETEGVAGLDGYRTDAIYQGYISRETSASPTSRHHHFTSPCYFYYEYEKMKDGTFRKMRCKYNPTRDETGKIRPCNMKGKFGQTEKCSLPILEHLPSKLNIIWGLYNAVLERYAMAKQDISRKNNKKEQENITEAERLVSEANELKSTLDITNLTIQEQQIYEDIKNLILKINAQLSETSIDVRMSSYPAAVAATLANLESPTITPPNSPSTKT